MSMIFLTISARETLEEFIKHSDDENFNDALRIFLKSCITDETAYNAVKMNNIINAKKY